MRIVLFQGSVLASMCNLGSIGNFPGALSPPSRIVEGYIVIEPWILQPVGIFNFQVTETPALTDINNGGDSLGHILEKLSQGWL